MIWGVVLFCFVVRWTNTHFPIDWWVQNDIISAYTSQSLEAWCIFPWACYLMCLNPFTFVKQSWSQWPMHNNIWCLAQKKQPMNFSYLKFLCSPAMSNTLENNSLKKYFIVKLGNVYYRKFWKKLRKKNYLLSPLWEIAILNIWMLWMTPSTALSFSKY